MKTTKPADGRMGAGGVGGTAWAGGFRSWGPMGLGLLAGGFLAATVGGDAPPTAPPAPAAGSGLPVGAIVAFAGGRGGVGDGTGWMLCDGRELASTAYPELFAVLGRAWGGNTSGSTFRLPDLRGRFLRGVNYDADGPLRDPDAPSRVASAEGGNSGNEVGTLQEDAAGPHTHPLLGAYDAVGQGLGAEVLRFYSSKIPDAEAPAVRNDGAVQPPAPAETRPRNAAVNWIIRAR